MFYDKWKLGPQLKLNHDNPRLIQQSFNTIWRNNLLNTILYDMPFFILRSFGDQFAGYLPTPPPNNHHIWPPIEAPWLFIWMVALLWVRNYVTFENNF